LTSNAKSTSKRGRTTQKCGEPSAHLQDLSVGPPDDNNTAVAQDLGDGPLEKIDKAGAVLSETDTIAVAAAADAGSDDTGTLVEEDQADEIARPMKKQKVALVEIAAYVDIMPAAQTPKAKEVTVTCGPFLFTVETKHDAFLQGIVSCAMSKGQSHSISSINQSQLYWKFNVPVNDKKKPLLTVVGYQALISSMKTVSKASYTVFCTTLLIIWDASLQTSVITVIAKMRSSSQGQLD